MSIARSDINCVTTSIRWFDAYYSVRSGENDKSIFLNTIAPDSFLLMFCLQVTCFASNKQYINLYHTISQYNTDQMRLTIKNTYEYIKQNIWEKKH